MASIRNKYKNEKKWSLLGIHGKVESSGVADE